MVSLDEESGDNEYSEKSEADKRRRDLEDYHHEMSGLETGRAKRFGNDRSLDQSGTSRRKRQAYADTDAFYLALINSNELGGFIASEVFGGKNDAEITDITAQIEAESGIKFGEYAKGILGPDGAARRPGESDIEYQRRMLHALADEMIDPQTGRIKAQYANDPLAKILRDDATYQRILRDVSQINRDSPSATADQIILNHKEISYATAEASGEHVKIDTYKSDLRDGQDDHRDVAINSSSINSESDSFFGREDITAQASEAARIEFNNTAALQVHSDITPTTSIGFSIGSRTT